MSSEQNRFFVTVTADSADHMRALATRGLDLFMPTAEKKARNVRIEGLLTLEEIGALVTDGYHVTVEAPMESRARASSEITSLDEWLQAMGE